MGYYATKCLHNKVDMKPSGEVEIGDLSSKFELDFTLIACMVSSVMGSVGYLDIGASFYMTDNKDFFSDLEEKDLHMDIEMGDDGRYSMTNIGLKKNLVSVAMLEDHGYDVIFSKGKAFICHIAKGQVKKNRVWVTNLYKLDVEDCTALSTTEKKVRSRDIGELWHRILGHLHHGDLNIMQHISTGLPKGALE
eukprot:PITA_09967